MICQYRFLSHLLPAKSCSVFIWILWIHFQAPFGICCFVFWSWVPTEHIVWTLEIVCTNVNWIEEGWTGCLIGWFCACLAICSYVTVFMRMTFGSLSKSGANSFETVFRFALNRFLTSTTRIQILIFRNVRFAKRLLLPNFDLWHCLIYPWNIELVFELLNLQSISSFSIFFCPCRVSSIHMY